MTIILFTILVDLTSAAENIIRNLEHIGISEVTAKQYWGWDWVYSHYSDTKRVLLGLQIFILLSTVTNTAKQKFKYAA
ncbi:hypothetical protein CJF42_21460 [Pseudoalteromonas sp. NBT06-2]|uniref:hypothetical protein n=1 Tax=Pseudoalteromonas sp. NBT06-2 TaxID=2025950 RepID=UPI000BD3C14D|nr:hypothetical protein [Pseudoalteromonas sp. NBT06-2]PAJ72405.1 hypothetical protein CJF42_21460 [Pseudoalteromonas sp. NBT06-2]